LGVDETDIEDVCQEVFLIVHRKLAAFEGRSSLRTWVYGICVRTAADYRKRRRTRGGGALPLADEPWIAQSQDDELALREARVLLDRILVELDVEKRAFFVLYEIEELSMGEVAAALGCPEATAYSRLRAARREVEGAILRLRARGGAR
jgi:RNA polymerase sigma-70 factor (ECF subfamily)